MSAPLLTDRTGPPRRAGLLVLATTTFVVVTTEPLPVGLLTPVSDDLPEGTCADRRVWDTNKASGPG
ncbi:hypothetical protein OG413_29750 [Streptomyces sp. NBC_01433]|uniref:hypothetical protein n=1 Tax=Streptomyces sp. NBC_01433 TaxID=2903864 RepID=UPI002256FA0E|nr:hypothetical protein [Streptomyces sp. NBC_01433]MCX4679423.1 hypothetical protein [Streptomyces sp. NBC_01433]